MKNPFSSKNLPEPLRRRVEMAVAVAQERLLNTHVDYALNLIELVGDDMPLRDVLSIYIRLLRLSDDEARIITTRALATLGEREEEEAGAEPPPTEPIEEEDVAERGDRRSFLRNIRQRLRGRAHDETRRVVELAAARTEVALLETHVENALHFVDLLDGEQSLQDSVELYLDALDVRDAIAEAVYYISLSRLSKDVLSVPAPERRERPEAPATEEERLRMVESESR